MNVTRPATVLYVDQDVHDRVAAREALPDEHVLSVAEGSRALAAARLYQPDVIVVGKLADMATERFVWLVRAERRLANTPVVVLDEPKPVGSRLRQLVSQLAAPHRS